MGKTWREIRGQLPLSESLMAVYKRLIEAEACLEPVRLRRGVDESAFGVALEAAEAELGPDCDDGLYMSVLSRYVAALGGSLEVRAVFPDGDVMLPG